jgi:pimeloyl-ACP methyl ester carboxylesterase
MVLLHGITDSWYSFENVLRYLPETVHAFALTQRGHGDADRPAAGYGMRDFAADVAEFIRVHDLGPTIIVGHSMGSTVAQRFAIDYPERTLGLVLAGAFAAYCNNPAAVEFSQSVAELTDPISPTFVRAFQESTLAQSIPPAFLDMVVAESLKVPARVWQAALDGCLDDECAGELGRITAPSRILWGARDKFCPRRDQDALLAAIAGSRLEVYERAGHALHWEEPERFAADLVTFAQILVSDPAGRTVQGLPSGLSFSRGLRTMVPGRVVAIDCPIV